MDLSNMVDCEVNAKKRGSRNELYIESMRFDKASKLKLPNVLKSPNSDNMVLRASCLIIDHGNFQNIKPGNRFSGNFFPDSTEPFEIRHFDVYFKSGNVVSYDDYVEISEVSIVIYAV
jgi:hypothetical protein